MPPPLSTAWVWLCGSAPFGLQKLKYSLEKASIFLNVYTVQKDVTYTKHQWMHDSRGKRKEMVLTSARSSAHVLLPSKTKSIFVNFCRTSFSVLFLPLCFSNTYYLLWVSSWRVKKWFLLFCYNFNSCIDVAWTTWGMKSILLIPRTCTTQSEILHLIPLCPPNTPRLLLKEGTSRSEMTV